MKNEQMKSIIKLTLMMFGIKILMEIKETQDLFKSELLRTLEMRKNIK